MLSVENISAAAGPGTTLVVAHDASAEEMKEAILAIAEGTLGGFVGNIYVSRYPNGAEGLQAYR